MVQHAQLLSIHYSCFYPRFIPHLPPLLFKSRQQQKLNNAVGFFRNFGRLTMNYFWCTVCSSFHPSSSSTGRPYQQLAITQHDLRFLLLASTFDLFLPSCGFLAVFVSRFISVYINSLLSILGFYLFSSVSTVRSWCKLWQCWKLGCICSSKTHYTGRFLFGSKSECARKIDCVFSWMSVTVKKVWRPNGSETAAGVFYDSCDVDVRW